MNVVHKHPLSDDDVVTTLPLPVGARVLHVAEQRGHLYLWEVHDETALDVEVRDFVLFGTGQPFPDDPSRHVGTVLLNGGALVFHLFEVTQP